MNSDDKIIKLKTIITPIINYFAIQDKLDTGDYSDEEYEVLDKLLYKENIQSKDNLIEIVKILKTK